MAEYRYSGRRGAWERPNPGFEDGISAAQYQAVAKATATRHLADLLEKDRLVRLPGGGRSTRYRIAVAD